MTDDRSHLSGAERIAEERHRQVALGWSRAHDNEHDDGSLARAAWCYLESVVYPESVLAHINWPWDNGPKLTDPVRNLEKAGALIAAEIDRRAASPSVRSEPTKRTTPDHGYGDIRQDGWTW